MRTLLLDLWTDESGTASVEWAFVASILVLGAITGLVATWQGRLERGDRPAVVRPR